MRYLVIIVGMYPHVLLPWVSQANHCYYKYYNSYYDYCCCCCCCCCVIDVVYCVFHQWTHFSAVAIPLTIEHWIQHMTFAVETNVTPAVAARRTDRQTHTQTPSITIPSPLTWLAAKLKRCIDIVCDIVHLTRVTTDNWRNGFRWCFNVADIYQQKMRAFCLNVVSLCSTHSLCYYAFNS